MLGRVVEGRYAGASVHRLPDRNVLYFQTEDGRKIALSRKNVLSVENVTDQYPDYGRKVMMVIWTDYEASIFAIGIPPVREELQEEIPAPAVSVPMPYEQAQEEPRKKKKAGKILLVVLGILGLMAVVGIVVLLTWHRHTWTPATCTAPKTCEECGETEGTRRPHEWVDATCEEAKTCTSCGKTKGDPLGHTWEEATCETAKTCSRCGSTEGTALGHKKGQWEITSEPKNGAAGTKTISCRTCGSVLETKEFLYPYFDMSFEEFVRRHNATYSAQGWSIREVSSGFSYYMNGKETAIIFHDNLNYKSAGATAYSTKKWKEFNKLQVRFIIRGSVVDYDNLSLTLMVGGTITQPLANYELSTFADKFLDVWTVERSSDTYKEGYAIMDGYKYTLRAYVVTDSYSRVFYEWVCEPV